MGKSLKTYKELLAEKEKLEQLIRTQKELISGDIEEIKWRIKPLSAIRSHVTQFTARNAASLFLALSSDIITKKIFKKIMIARTGWLGKVLVPYFLKNYTSGFLAEEKKKIIRWFKKEFKKPVKQAGASFSE